MERTYDKNELIQGKCSCCSEYSDEIVAGAGKCVDCIFEIEAFEASLQDRHKDGIDEGACDDDDNDDFEPCDNCDLPDACADYGCAIKQGVRDIIFFDDL